MLSNFLVLCCSVKSCGKPFHRIRQLFSNRMCTKITQRPFPQYRSQSSSIRDFDSTDLVQIQGYLEDSPREELWLLSQSIQLNRHGFYLGSANFSLDDFGHQSTFLCLAFLLCGGFNDFHLIGILKKIFSDIMHIVYLC